MKKVERKLPIKQTLVTPVANKSNTFIQNQQNKNTTLKTQNNSAFEQAVDLILSFEWFTDTCKWDNKQYSWWYGTACKTPGAKISIENARAEFMQHVKGNYDRVISLNPNLTEDEIVWLVSFYYNTGNYNDTVHYVKKGDIASVKYIMNKYINKGSIYEKWLTKRRSVEIAAMEWVELF